MVDSIVQWFTDNLSGVLPKEMIVFIISMLPILELRGGLIAASVLKIDLLPALLICITGNILPIPFILLFITKIFNLLKKTKLFRPIVEKLDKKDLSKQDKIGKYEFWGLLLFVGIPLPGTGAWTGALLASMLDMKLKKSVPPIFLGILLAAAIMTIISYVIPWIVKSF